MEGEIDRTSVIPRSRLELSEKAIINVSGTRFEVMWFLIKMRPLTRLEKLHTCFTQGSNWETFCDSFDEERQEFFFQRDPDVFRAILSFYWTNKIHVPKNVCVQHFQKELKYWGIGLKYVEECCHHYYQQENEVVENMRKVKAAFQRNLSLQRSYENIEHTTEQRKWAQLRTRLWDLFENPQSSRAAKVVYFLSSFFVILSTVALCLNTIDSIQEKRSDGTTGDNSSLAVVEAVCIGWFTLEYAIRLASSPEKIPFLKGLMNTIDILAILPYFITLLFHAFDNRVDERLVDMRRFIQILRILRIIRIFKMARHSIGLQTLAYTFKHSSSELGLLVLLLLMGMTLFSSLVYFAEEGDPASQFKSIPEAFWWAVITMTTVGYGDMYPVTPLGKVVGCLCCTSGIIFIALPIPTIVSNFSQFYKDQRKNAAVLRRLSKVEGGILEMHKNKICSLAGGKAREGSDE